MDQTDNTLPLSKKRVSMSTIAKALGVTKTTVSLALKDDPSISEKTTKRVKSLADKLDYRPDPAISSIASQRWNVITGDHHRIIAFLCHRDAAHSTYQNYFFPAANKRANDLGYKMERFFVDDYPSAKSISNVLYSRGIRGLVIPPIQTPDSSQIIDLDWSKFTAVCCGIGRVRPKLHSVAPDTFAHTSLIWSVLKSAGYKRIGAALHCHTPVAYDDWLRVGATNASIHFLDLPESATIPLHTDNIQNSASLLEWYAAHKPEVIIGFNELVCDHLEKAGVRVPEDVQYVSLNTPPKTKWSGIVHLYNEIGQKSVELLSNEIRNNRWGLPANPEITLVQPRWNRGETLETEPEIIDGILVSILPESLAPLAHVQC